MYMCIHTNTNSTVEMRDDGDNALATGLAATVDIDRVTTVL